MPGTADIRRIDLGYFIRPADETGTGAPRLEPVLAYAVQLAAGWLLFDTGVGTGNDEVDSHYRPVRRALPEALRTAGVDIADVRMVANCHLHFDHCGGNPDFPHVPIIVQSTELALAREAEFHTLPHLIDFPGVSYEPLDGETELFPGVWVIPTPGHTDGHQSLVVRSPDGTVVLAGQAHDFAVDFTSEYLTRAAREGALPEPLPISRAWMDRVDSFDPARVLFAHDMAVWEPA